MHLNYSSNLNSSPACFSSHLTWHITEREHAHTHVVIILLPRILASRYRVSWLRLFYILLARTPTLNFLGCAHTAEKTNFLCCGRCSQGTKPLIITSSHNYRRAPAVLLKNSPCARPATGNFYLKLDRTSFSPAGSWSPWAAVLLASQSMLFLWKRQLFYKLSKEVEFFFNKMDVVFLLSLRPIESWMRLQITMKFYCLQLNLCYGHSPVHRLQYN